MQTPLSIERVAPRGCGQFFNEPRNRSSAVRTLPRLFTAPSVQRSAKARADSWLRSALKLRALVGGAACLLAWGVLWLLLIAAYQQVQIVRDPSPVDSSMRCYPLTRSDAGREDGDRTSRGDKRPCPSGMIEVEGQCVMGEEIEVRAPRRWTRR
jgi:hypothetical protein